MLTRARLGLWLGGLAVLSLAASLWAPSVGAVRLDVLEALAVWWRHEPARGPLPPDAAILVTLRLPRVLLAWLVGGGLALAGAAFQGMLRNPLATPYTLGVAGGGALGAVVAVSFPALGWRWGPLDGVQLWSLAGSGAVVALIYGLARGRRDVSPIGLLLAGVVVAAICGAGILFVRYLAVPARLVALDRYLMGGLDVAGWRPVQAMLPFYTTGAALLLLQARRLEQIALGEELATARGVDVAALQRWCFFGGSLLVAGVVAVAGPIAFVGLIVPHVLRGLGARDHRLLLPASLLAGGVFLLICDTAARTAFPALTGSPTELPVGILTALLGGPFFLVILLRSRSELGA